MESITKQLERGGEVSLDFKMSSIKPLLYQWLYEAWFYVFEKPNMICKGWKQAGFLRAFEKKFQIEAMKENMITPLFPIVPHLNTPSLVEPEKTSKDLASNPNDSMEEAIQPCLDHVVALSSVPSTPASVLKLRVLARRSIKPKSASK